MDGGDPRRIEFSKRRCALNQGNLGPSHSRKFKLCLRNGAGALEQDCIATVAGDFADKFIQLFRKCRR